MARYHINRRGEAKQCRARVKPCPLGLAPEEHYPTREAAEAAYEALMAAGVQGPGRPQAARVRKATTRQEAAALTAVLPPEQVFLGKASPATASDLEKLEQASHRIEELLAHPFSLTAAEDEEGVGYVVEEENFPEGYRYLGMGTHRLALLDEETGLVYKLPTRALSDGRMEKLVQAEQESFALLEDSLFSPESPVRYARTYFHTSASGVPVVVQEHVEGEQFQEWVVINQADRGLREVAPEEVEAAHALLRLKDELHQQWQQEPWPLGDFVGGNVLYDARTGQVVLIDCLEVPSRFFDEARGRERAPWAPLWGQELSATSTSTPLPAPSDDGYADSFDDGYDDDEEDYGYGAWSDYGSSWPTAGAKEKHYYQNYTALPWKAYEEKLP